MRISPHSKPCEFRMIRIGTNPKPPRWRKWMKGFLQTNLDAFQDTLIFYNDFAYHEYEGLSLDLDERDWLAEHLGDMLVMIMKSWTADNWINCCTGICTNALYGAFLPSTDWCPPHRARTASAFRRNLQARAKQYEQSASLEAHEWDALPIRLGQFDPSYKN